MDIEDDSAAAMGDANSSMSPSRGEADEEGFHRLIMHRHIATHLQSIAFLTTRLMMDHDDQAEIHVLPSDAGNSGSAGTRADFE